jgi:hypothetical protein
VSKGSTIEALLRAASTSATEGGEKTPLSEEIQGLWQSARDLVSSFPRAFSSLRKGLGSDWVDTPFAINIEGENSYIAIPSQITENDKPKLAILGLLLSLADMAKIKPVPCTQVNQTEVWNTLLVLSDPLMGAVKCLERESISVQENIPRELQAGWEYSLWYAFSKATHETDHADFMKINRVTSLFTSSGSAWNKSTGFAVIQRIQALVRIAAQNSASKLSNLRGYLKGEGYFVEKFAGKKPIGGLYTDQELTDVTKEWTSRYERIRRLYKQIPDTTQTLPPGGLGSIIAEFNQLNSAKVKLIEDAKSKRIPMLLVTSQRGKLRTSVISQGGNLPEKLIHLDGGDSVRTIGRVLWSPIYGIPQNAFVDVAMRLTSNSLRGVGATTCEAEIQEAQKRGSVDLVGQLQQCSAAVNQTVNVYLEVLPNKHGNPSWDSVFGTPR